MTSIERYLTRLETLIEEAEQKTTDAPNPEEEFFWRGVLFGLESALDEFYKATAEEIAEQGD